MKIHCQTDRLLLREIGPNDLEDLYELDADPEVHRYLGNHPVTDIKQTEAIIQSLLDQCQKNGIARWACILKDTGEFIGWSGLKYEIHVRPGMEYYDLGYRFKQPFWGKGYATESALASRDYFFMKMEGEVLNAAAHVDNIGSNRVLQKTGMKSDGMFECDGSFHNWYTMDRSDWKNVCSKGK